MEKVNYEIVKNERKGCCLTRDVLYYIVFVGFAVNYMIRLNLNIAIVSMVKGRLNQNVSILNSTTDNLLLELKNITFEELENQTNRNTIYEETASAQPISNTFSWNEKQQSNILGAYFWLHWITQIPGGVLAARYGAKLVFGLSNFAGVLCCFLIPTAAHMGHVYLISLRIFQGFLCGFTWPAMHDMTARWIPPNERSKFVTAYLGSSVGAALTYPICGLIIHKWGWELVFYTCGVIGTLWYVAWFFLVYDNPSKHPRISEQEKEYILKSLGQTYSKKKAPVPWRQIFLSLPVWMNILAQWGGLWGFFTLMTHAPSYFKFIHGWSVQATGFLSGLGHLLRTTWSYICGQIADYLLRTNRVSRTNVRKVATAGSTIAQGLCLLALSFVGNNYTLAVVFLSCAVAMNGAVSAGPLACVVDISPNYASVVLGFVNTVVAMVGFITPAVVGYLTYQNQTIEQWQKVFWISTLMSVSCGIIFVIFIKSELQPWNSPDSQNALDSELSTIKSKEQEDNGTKNGYEKVPIKIDNQII